MSQINVAIVGTTVLTSLVESGDSVNVSIGSAVAGTSPLVTAGTIQIGNTTTLNTGQNATVTNKGSGIAAILDFGIPQGPAGVTPTLEVGLVSAVASGANAGVIATSANGGANVTLDFFLPVGQSPAFAIGNVTTLNAGSNATVNLASANNGANVSLSFGLPRGADGQNGVSPNLTIGNVTTLNAGLNATVNATTSNNGANVTFDFGIPRGSDGASAALSSNTPLNLGTAAVGTSNLAAREDHVHNIPVIDYTALSNRPANFPTNVALVSGLAADYAAINHTHNYVTSINGLTGAISLVAGPNVTITANTSNLTIDSKAGGVSENEVIDGGYYTGIILNGIKFILQPQSQTVSTSGNITFANTSNSPARYGVFSAGANLYSFGNAADSGGTTYANVLRSADNGGTWSTVSCVVLSGGEPQAITSFGAASAISNGSRTVVMPGLGTPPTQTANLAWPGVVYSDDANLASLSQVGGSGSSTFGTNARPYSLAYSATAARWVITTYGNEAKSPSMPDMWSSSDGASWTIRYSGAWGQDIGAAYAAARVIGVGGAFVAMLSRRTYYSNSLQANKVAPYLYSAAGLSWAETSNPFPLLTVNGIDFDAVQSIDIASSGTRAVAIRRTDVRYTTDGTTWGTATLPAACDRIEYARGLFWAWPEASGTDICTSPDGVTWTLRSRPASSVLYGLAAASGSNVAFLLNDGSTHATATFSGSAAASANFTVSATADGGASVNYQWQRSLDAGVTWANISGATSSALNLTGLTTANSAERYRARASATGASPAISQSATLTVTE